MIVGFLYLRDGEFVFVFHEGFHRRFRKERLNWPIRRVDSSTTSRFAEVYALLLGYTEAGMNLRVLYSGHLRGVEIVSGVRWGGEHTQ